MNIFAIDLGNKRIKMKSDRGEYSYPSSYMTTDFLSADSLAAHQQIKENQIYNLDADSSTSFIWGEALGIYNLPEVMIDTYGRSNRLKQKKTQRILEFALGRLAFDYKGTFSEESPLIIHVMIGAPITDMHKNSSFLPLLKHLLIGKHYLQINGEDIWIEIPSEDNISVIPQYMGSLLDLAFNDNLEPVDLYANGKMGIFDIGGGTVLINSSNALNLSPGGAEKFSGIQTLIKDISAEINSTKTFIIEQLLREGNKDTGYFYRTSRNKKDIKDISNVVNNAIEHYTRFTIAPLITENFPDLEVFDCILVTGGGAAIISKDALLDEIGEEYFERLVFTDTPELSNVKGFYKGAILKWGRDFEENEGAQQKIWGEWGTATVEFTPSTGQLNIYEGQLDNESFPASISRSEIREIQFLGSVLFPERSKGLFGSERYQSLEGAMTSLTVITGMDFVSTEQVVDMSFMFNGCKALKDIDLSHFNTSKVTNFSNMFANCEDLRTLNLSSFDSSVVENFDSMFLNCKVLDNLDLGHFDMKASRTKLDMFEGCISLENISLPPHMLYKD